MKIPEFTAEASLARSGRVYGGPFGFGRAATRAEGVIRPQQFRYALTCQRVPILVCGLCDPDTGICPPCYWTSVLSCPGDRR
jgi:hypothetical protein